MMTSPIPSGIISKQTEKLTQGEGFRPGEFKSIVRADGVTKKYAFDEEGKISRLDQIEQGERQTGDDAWQTGVYYLGGADDLLLRSHQWERLDGG